MFEGEEILSFSTNLFSLILMVKMRGGVNGDEEFDEAGRDDDVEEASD